MTATIPIDIARSLGLTKTGDEAALEVTEVQPGSVTVMVETESESENPTPAPAGPPPELMAALAAA